MDNQKIQQLEQNTRGKLWPINWRYNRVHKLSFVTGFLFFFVILFSNIEPFVAIKKNLLLLFSNDDYTRNAIFPMVLYVILLPFFLMYVISSLMRLNTLDKVDKVFLIINMLLVIVIAGSLIGRIPLVLY